MKKLLIILGIIIIIAGLAGAGYWYWQNQVPAMQKVALDNSNIKSFDDVCKKDSKGVLGCEGNITQFGCISYTDVPDSFQNLQPFYPMLICLKNYALSKEGIYHQSQNGTLAVELVDYIIIKDNVFQIIQSEDQLRQVFQPIESVDEAKAYFATLHKGFLIVDEKILNNLKSGDAEQYKVPMDQWSVSTVIKDGNNFIINAYSQYSLVCVDDLYLSSYTLKQNGSLVEKTHTLLWESKSKPACIN